MFVTPMGTGTTAAVRPIAEENKAIIFGPGSGSPMFTQPYNPLFFLTIINYYDQMHLVVDYLVKERGLRRLPFLVQKSSASTQRATWNVLRSTGLRWRPMTRLHPRMST